MQECSTIVKDYKLLLVYRIRFMVAGAVGCLVKQQTDFRIYTQLG